MSHGSCQSDCPPPECGLGAELRGPRCQCGTPWPGKCPEVFLGAQSAAIIAARVAQESTAAVVVVRRRSRRRPEERGA
eukprot:9499298-Pyramimonas_sp.AAC.1